MQQLEEVKEFIREYDKNKNLTFCHLSPFPQAKVVQPFGLQFFDSSLKFNRGTFFSDYSSFLQKFITPFYTPRIFFYDDLNLMEIKTIYDFSLRIYHVHEETFSIPLQRALEQESPLEKNTILGKSGIVHPLKKTLSYMELVSEKEIPSFLHKILDLKYLSMKYEYPYTKEELEILFDFHNLPEKESMKTLQKIKKENFIEMMNSFCAYMKDPVTREYRYFYSYNALF